MSLNDVGFIRFDDKGWLRVAARSGTIGLRWPPVVQFHEKFYKFNANEEMDMDFLNAYGGHASYVEISQKEALLLDSSPVCV